MNKKVVLSLLASAGIVGAFAEKKDPVALKINGNPVTKSEFEYIYHKNSTATEADQKSLDDYLNLFITYKLKVEEAKTQKLDTTSSFRKEYAGYKSQLAEPYLLDTLSEQTLAKKYYDRLSEDLEVSHILISFTKKEMLPADTLALYNKAMDIRKKLMDTSNPLSFEKAAEEYSSDHSGKKPGYLGWVTANMLVSPFENAIYSLKVGSISLPVRTNFGYHLILLHNKRPDPGMARVAHIMFATNQGMSKEQVDSVYDQAEKIYKKLQAGEDYAKLAQEYSFDKYSSEHGGEVGWVSVGARFPSEWIEASLALKNANDYSTPIKTDYGYHIIKLLEKKPRDSFSAMQSQLVGYLKNGDRKTELNRFRVAKLKNEIKLEVNAKSLAALHDLSQREFPTDSSFIADANKLKQPLFKIGDNLYTTTDFASYLKTDKSRNSLVSTEFLDNAFDAYSLEKLTVAKEQGLAKQYPEFKDLSNEYFDGILLFDIMNKEVWQKAEKDTAGLEKYFEENRSKFVWKEPKYKGYVVHCKNQSTMDQAKAIIAANIGAKNLPQLLSALNDSTARVNIEVGTWSEGDNPYVDKQFYGKELKKDMKAFPLFFVEARSINAPEEYTDVRGQIISDYQDTLEKEWVESLHKKYKVEINKKVLKTIN